MVSVMVGYKPTDTFNLLVGISSYFCEHLAGNCRTFLFLKFAVLVSMFLLARPYSDIMHESCTFEDELSFLVQAFVSAYQ